MKIKCIDMSCTLILSDRVSNFCAFVFDDAVLTSTRNCNEKSRFVVLVQMRAVQ